MPRASFLWYARSGERQELVPLQRQPLVHSSRLEGEGGQGEPGAMAPSTPHLGPFVSVIHLPALFFGFCFGFFLRTIGKGKMKLHSCVGSGNKVRITERALSLIFYKTSKQL